MTIHSVFGASPPPGTYNVFTDGTPSIQLASRFYRTSAVLDTSTIVGGRVNIPAAVPGATGIRIMLWVDSKPMQDPPTQSVVVPLSGTGWHEGMFPSATPIPPVGNLWRVGYEFVGAPTAYLFTNGMRPDSSGNPLSPQSNGLVLSEERSLLRFGTGAEQQANTYAIGYGIDALLDDNVGPDPEPEPPANVIPIVNGGIDRSIFLGQSANLTATSSDPDGTIAAVNWTKISGPAVEMGGSGANRTITPTELGVYVFSVVAVDDDGAQSVPDTVQITVLPAPAVDGSASREVRINRRVTEQFIKADPVVLELQGHTLVKKAGGGRKLEPNEGKKSAQMFRLIPQTDVQPSVQTPDGIQLTPTFVLLGRFDADLNRWDTFELNGHSYQVVSTVRPEHSIMNRYEVKADVARN